MPENELSSMLADSAAEVLETMFFTSTTGDGEPPTAVGEPNIRARLSFRGEPPGRFGVCASVETGRRIAASFLGTEEEEVTEAQIGEVVSELANMLCGSVLSRLEKETRFELSHPEIDPPGTECAISPAAALWLLTLQWARDRKTLPPRVLRQKALALARVPAQAAQCLKEYGMVSAMARRYARNHNFLYLGRGINYPIALEGALKLKEISYIHAEGYPGGEMKHGPIALIDRKMPVVAIALKSSKVYEKMLSNMEE
ncbi:MAG TPA: SIS domain-containing protein, partial [Bryobacteraceae bacterium]|nr:SIS domain-containing protein [Bryobacteraceae bacterium]